MSATKWSIRAKGYRRLRASPTRSSPGCNMSCYTLRLLSTDSKVVVPVANSERVGLRPLSEKSSVSGPSSGWPRATPMGSRIGRTAIAPTWSESRPVIWTRSSMSCAALPKSRAARPCRSASERCTTTPASCWWSRCRSWRVVNLRGREADRRCPRSAGGADRRVDSPQRRKSAKTNESKGMPGRICPAFPWLDSVRCLACLASWRFNSCRRWYPRGVLRSWRANGTIEVE